MMKKRGQASIEYLILIGFITLAITLVLLASYFYVGLSQDRIKVNQIESAFHKVISSAESVFYSGVPSQTTINIYLPQGVESINISGTEILVSYSTTSGTNTRSFGANVNLSGTISIGEGSKNLVVKAQSGEVIIE